MQRKTGSAESLGVMAADIRQAIDDSPGRVISFRDYMELCLYHPVQGYYTGSRIKVGKEGDFYTSSGIGSLMGEMVARQIMREASELSDASSGENGSDAVLRIAEWGGGTGRLAAHMLEEIRQHDPRLYRRIEFTSVEQSVYHRELQRNELAGQTCALRFMTPEEWMGEGKHRNTIVIANELIDAFPVHRVRRQGNRLFELYVTWDESDGLFKTKLVALKDGDLNEHLQEFGIRLQDGQTAEFNLEGCDWIRRIAGAIDSGAVIVVDYGDTAAEIYAPHRMDGTLMCYRNHHAHDNPFVHTGEQDITAHVDFTALMHTARSSGLSVSSFRTQKQFLVDNGILDELQQLVHTDPFHPAARRNRAIRQLLLSDGMSELFKVLIMTQLKKNLTD